jgi:hypothetical protein
MSNEDPKTGLWKKESTNGGASYYSGKITIDQPGEYWVNLYKNDRKETDSQPDLNLKLKPKDVQAAPRKAPPAPQFADDDIGF